jgi:hypothetical protein
MHVATLSSPRRSALPWPLVRYSASWSTRSEGLKCFMAEASEWHDAHRAGMSLGDGLPRNPFFGSWATSWSSARGSPPWQEAHVKPERAWMSSAKSFAGGLTRASSRARWQSTQPIEATAFEGGVGVGGPAGAARAPEKRTPKKTATTASRRVTA